MKGRKWLFLDTLWAETIFSFCKMRQGWSIPIFCREKGIPQHSKKGIFWALSCLSPVSGWLKISSSVLRNTFSLWRKRSFSLHHSESECFLSPSPAVGSLEKENDLTYWIICPMYSETIQAGFFSSLPWDAWDWIYDILYAKKLCSAEVGLGKWRLSHPMLNL